MMEWGGSRHGDGCEARAVRMLKFAMGGGDEMAEIRYLPVT